MNGEIYVNTPELREHLAGSREELRLTDELLTHTRRLKYFDLLSGDHRCREAENEIQRTEELLSKLFGAMGTFCNEAEELITKNAKDLTMARDNAMEALQHIDK